MGLKRSRVTWYSPDEAILELLIETNKLMTIRFAFIYCQNKKNYCNSKEQKVEELQLERPFQNLLPYFFFLVNSFANRKERRVK